jgi:choline dehydrogenase-like flavoprotein
MGQDAESFDYVIVGAGSAGCVLANRLSADPGNKVCVLEAGGEDRWIWFHIPVGYLFAIGNPRSDWMYRTEPVVGLNGRAIDYPRGKAIGGSSAINAMIYMRGQAADYDGWRQLGLDGWGWDDVLPLFLKHEDHFLGASKHHAVGGELHIDAPRARWRILDAFIEAAETSGIPRTPDFNTGDNEGAAYFHVNQKNGRRWSAASAFLKPVRNRANLKVELGARIARVIFDGRKAVGVAFEQDGHRREVKARREVILSAGAVASPQILQLSGVGPAELLGAHGVPIVQDLPGVGENLQDHLQLRPIYKVRGTRTLNQDYYSLWRKALMGLEYVLFRHGPLAMAPSHVGAFTRSSPERGTPNLQFHVQPLSLDKFGAAPHRFSAMTISVCNLKPESRGTIRLKSPDPRDAPAIAPNYLAAEADRRVAVDALRLVRRIVQAPALARYVTEEFRPGSQVQTDADLAKAAGDIGSTIFHPVGTAKMGPESDAMAVTDHRLRLRGVEGLRVVDASVMPRITSGNTNAPTMMIAEKGAAMILEDAQR